MAVTRLFYASTVSQHNGEGGISTGATPLEWGFLGLSVGGGTSDATGLLITRANAFTNYNWTTGDILRLYSGSSGTLTGDRTITSKNSSNQVTVDSTVGASKTNILASVFRNSLVGALGDYPSSIPGVDAPSSFEFDNFACYEPQLTGVTSPTKILRPASFKLVGDTLTLAQVLAADNPSSITSVGVGVRIGDVSQNGAGVPYAIRMQLRNSGGSFGSAVDYSGGETFVDGGAAPSADFFYYLNPGVIDGSLGATVAQLSDAGFGINFQLQQQSGDTFEASTQIGVNGFLLKVVYDLPPSSGGGIGPADRFNALHFGGAYRQFSHR